MHVEAAGEGGRSRVRSRGVCHRRSCAHGGDRDDTSSGGIRMSRRGR